MLIGGGSERVRRGAIVLIGYRGSGKSSIGKRLANLLWMDFADTDTLLVERAGKTIKEIFETEGEPAFRDKESAILQELAAKDKLVIAAGGGIILRPDNIAALKKNAKIIWLKADPKILLTRIQSDPATAANRPSLTEGGVAGSLEEITTILEKRTPLYQAAADASLEVTYLSIEDAAQRLTALI